MTTAPGTTAPVDLAWQAYQDDLSTAGRDYHAAVGEAQRHYDADVKAAIDTYHSAERIAFQAFTVAERAAKYRYLQVAVTPGGGPRPAQPVFTPHPETEK